MGQHDSGYQSINAYGVIGNCHSAVLVGPDGSIDWGCLPDFDSPAIFCRLLDCERGGYFQLAPADTSISGVQSYLQGSAVLQTRFSSLTGEIVLTDFMPVETLRAWPCQETQNRSWILVRRLTCTYGQLPVRMLLKVTPQYAASASNIALLDNSSVVVCGDGQYVGLFIAGQPSLPSFPMHVERTEERLHPVIVAQFTLHEGEELFFALGAGNSPQDTYRLVEKELPGRDFAAELEHTLQRWRAWLAKCTYHGPYKEAVHRSALTLKMMTYAPTGAIVAAPTTSLPETVGGERNWDYRYTWLRDASFTLSALSRLGFTDEARAFIHWLCSFACAGKKEPQVMYGIRGERHLPEYELWHLSGYRDSHPVRVGNAAAGQRQLDIFGEVLDCIYLSLSRENNRSVREQITGPMWEVARRFIEYVCANWQEPDAGIWEVRGEQRHYVYSKVMCWVALDRGIRLAERFHLKADLARWQRLRDQIRLNILTYGYNSSSKTFTQTYMSNVLDASCLYLPLVGFIAADDPRMRSTVDGIIDQLTDEHGFVYRYHSDDGLTGAEGTFLMCTFWLVDNLALQGRVDEARTLFERALACAGKTGLLSEEVAPATNQALGNYPQAFSHLALIHSALNLQAIETRLAASAAEVPLVAA